METTKVSLSIWLLYISDVHSFSLFSFPPLYFVYVFIFLSSDLNCVFLHLRNMSTQQRTDRCLRRPHKTLNAGQKRGKNVELTKFVWKKVFFLCLIQTLHFLRTKKDDESLTVFGEGLKPRLSVELELLSTHEFHVSNFVFLYPTF